MSSWEQYGIAITVLSVLWVMKRVFIEGVNRIVEKLDEVIDVLNEGRPNDESDADFN